MQLLDDQIGRSLRPADLRLGSVLLSNFHSFLPVDMIHFVANVSLSLQNRYL
jgi:hypothetical protein